MTSQGSRLKKIRNELKLSQEEFGKSLGLTRAAIAAVEADNNKFSQDILCKLLLTFDVNINYLLGGKGQMFNSKIGAAQYEDVKASVLEEVRMMLRDEGIIK